MLLAAFAELGPSGKKVALRRQSLEPFLAMAPFTVRCFSALPGQAPTSRNWSTLAPGTERKSLL
jgi:hypothetical protein